MPTVIWIPVFAGMPKVLRQIFVTPAKAGVHNEVEY